MFAKPLEEAKGQSTNNFYGFIAIITRPQLPPPLFLAPSQRTCYRSEDRSPVWPDGGREVVAPAHPRCTDSQSLHDTGTHGSSCSGDPVVAGMTAHLQSQLLTAGSNKDFH